MSGCRPPHVPTRMKRFTPSWTSSSITIAADGDPVERVLLEDVARRGLGRFAAVRRNGRLSALCHVGANLVPAGDGCAAFSEHALNGAARMMVGSERAVGELWDAIEEDMPPP